MTKLPPALAKRFRSGRASLDFAHTGDAGLAEPELLADRAGLERWTAHVLGLTGVRAEPDDVADALRLRSALWGLARARAHGVELDPSEVETLNHFAASAPPAPRMAADGTFAPQTATATAALSAIARDAMDLFAGPLGHRVRICAGEGCALLFVDASRPGTRRWCSMERCGNLSKLRTHRGGKAETTVTPGRSADPTRG